MSASENYTGSIFFLLSRLLMSRWMVVEAVTLVPHSRIVQGTATDIGFDSRDQYARVRRNNGITFVFRDKLAICHTFSLACSFALSSEC
jgi:hypothetical protein